MYGSAHGTVTRPLLAERTSKTWLVYLRLPWQDEDIMIDVKKTKEPVTGRQTLALYQTLGQQYDLRAEPADETLVTGRR